MAGPGVVAGLIVHPFDDTGGLLRRYRDVVKGAPDELTAWIVLRKAPPLPFLAPEVHGQDVLVLPVFSPSRSSAIDAAIERIGKLGDALGMHVGPMPYAAWQQAFDPLLTPGARNYWKSHNFSQLSDEAIEVVLRYAGALPTSQCEIFLGLLGAQASVPASQRVCTFITYKASRCG